MSSTSRAMRQSFGLRFASGSFLVLWSIIAAFPIMWIAIMSFKSPVDAFADSPWQVIMGPATKAAGNGLSIIDIVLGLCVLFFTIRWAFTRLPSLVTTYAAGPFVALGWIVGAAANLMKCWDWSCLKVLSIDR